ncbi:MAG TPA: peroxiredoxin-like family protein [Pirellulaceae bacterium]|nr:peroxiredoxin-like family protein [Pirellulaceae bacterium]
MNRDSSAHLRWGKPWLLAAGVYNLLWGGSVILFPSYYFSLVGMEPLNHLSIWQSLGMVIGLYGFGYLLAAQDYRRHWPIVLVGLLGKIAGPIGFVWSAWRGDLTWAFGAMIVTNDIIWWAPFAMLLWDTARFSGEYGRQRGLADGESRDAVLKLAVDQNHRNLWDLSHQRPTFVLLLRHAGCTFCKEALADLSAKRQEIESAGFGIAVVTMSHPETMADLAKTFKLETASWFSDRSCLLYRAFELQRGTFWQLFGPHVWKRAIPAILRGHFVGRIDGDGFQMPGAFLIHRGEIQKAFRHQHAAQRLPVAEFVLDQTQ